MPLKASDQTAVKNVKPVVRKKKKTVKRKVVRKKN